MDLNGPRPRGASPSSILQVGEGWTGLGLAVTRGGRRLAVRRPEVPDIPLICEYWRSASDADLARMGEPRRPDVEAIGAFLGWFCQQRPTLDAAGEYLLIWEVDGRAVGYSTLKAVRAGDRGELHLHLCEAPLRGQGLGAVLFCLSALVFRHKFALPTLVCQPSAGNPAPNRMLQRVGFPSLGAVDAPYAVGDHAARPGSSPPRLERYDIGEPVVRRYLERACAVPPGAVRPD